MGPRTIRIQDATFIVDVSGIEQLVKAVSWLAPVRHIPFHRVEFTDPFGKLDMRCIIEACVPEDTYAILSVRQHQTQSEKTLGFFALGG